MAETFILPEDFFKDIAPDEQEKPQVDSEQIERDEEIIESSDVDNEKDDNVAVEESSVTAVDDDVENLKAVYEYLKGMGLAGEVDELSSPIDLQIAVKKVIDQATEQRLAHLQKELEKKGVFDVEGAIDLPVEEYKKYNDILAIGESDLYEKEDAREKVLRKYLAEKGLDDDSIEATIEAYKAAGTDKEMAVKALQGLEKIYETKRLEYKRQQEEKERQRQESFNQYIQSVAKTYQSTEVFLGQPVSDAVKSAAVAQLLDGSFYNKVVSNIDRYAPVLSLLNAMGLLDKWVDALGKGEKKMPAPPKIKRGVKKRGESDDNIDLSRLTF